MTIPRLVSAVLRPRIAVRRALAVLFGMMSLHGSVGAQAQGADYRSPDMAPAAWGQFAGLVKLRFEERMVVDEPVANRFRAWLAQAQGKPDGAPASLIVRAWIRPDGTVERVSFPALSDAGANDDLQAILTRGNLGAAPPADMLQPLNLRFSLNLPT